LGITGSGDGVPQRALRDSVCANGQDALDLRLTMRGLFKAVAVIRPAHLQALFAGNMTQNLLSTMTSGRYSSLAMEPRFFEIGGFQKPMLLNHSRKRWRAF
jgi:hypothetical protein